jgi:hypothetical protein
MRRHHMMKPVTKSSAGERPTRIQTILTNGRRRCRSERAHEENGAQLGECNARRLFKAPEAFAGYCPASLGFCLCRSTAASTSMLLQHPTPVSASSSSAEARHASCKTTTELAYFKTGVVKSLLQCYSALCLDLFDGVHEAVESGGIDVAYGDDFEIAGVKTSDVESGAVSLHWVLFRGS